MENTQEQEEKQQRESSSEKTKNAINTARRLRRVYKNNPAARQGTKIAGNLAKKAGSQLARQAVIAIAATSEIWVPILLILLIIIMGIVLITTIFGGSQSVNAGQVDCLSVSGASCQITGTSCPVGTSVDASGTYTCSTGGTAVTRVCCLPPESTSSDIVRWAKIISNAETSGCASHTWYNRLWQTVTNGSYTIPYYAGNCSGTGSTTYFCTYLIRDAYKLAGIPGPTNSWTCTQMSQVTNLGFRIQGNDIRGVSPGDMIYWGYTSSSSTRYCSAAGFYVAHVDMVYNINITDPANGNGSMQTLDSNANRKIANYTLRGWRIVSKPWAFNTWRFAIRP